MARSIKKVRKPKTKKFWIILSCSIVAVIVGIIVGLLVWYMCANCEKLETHFTEYTKYKLNYNEIEDLINPEKDNDDYKEAFIFVYDDSFVFDKPDCDTDDPEYETYLLYCDAQTEFANLVKLCEKANETERDDGMKTGIFLINASLTTNSTILSNDSYDSLTSPAILGFHQGEGTQALTYVKTSETITGKDAAGKDAEYTISGGSSVKAFIKTVKEIEDYVSYTYNVKLDSSSN